MLIHIKICGSTVSWLRIF